MARLNDDWCRRFRGTFQDEEDVIEFIFERLNTDNFEDSYIDVAGYGEPNEMFTQTEDDKRQLLYDFMMWLVNNRKD